MTFLELLQRLAADTGTTNQTISTVSGVSGEILRLKNWLNDAYMDLQREHPDWEWLRSSFSFTTTNAQQIYTLTDIGISTTFGKWKPETFRSYITSSGYGTEIFMQYSEYEAWRDLWQFGANRTLTSRPTLFTILPNKSIGLGPTPNSVGYTVLGDYYTAPVEMSADSDEPAFPSKFHMILVYRAMMSYGVYESATEVYQRGQQKYGELLSQLQADQLPIVIAGAALA